MPIALPAGVVPWQGRSFCEPAKPTGEGLRALIAKIV
jgi:hypothetical protein